MIPPKFTCPNQYLGPMHTKPKRIWDGILSPNTFEWIHQFFVTDPDKRSHALNKVNSELGSYILG